MERLHRATAPEAVRPDSRRRDAAAPEAASARELQAERDRAGGRLAQVRQGVQPRVLPLPVDRHAHAELV